MILEPVLSSIDSTAGFELAVYVNAKDQPVNAVDLHLNFNAAALQITGVKAAETDGWIQMQSEFDNDSGTLDFAAVTFGESTGLIPVCIIRAQKITLQHGSALTFEFEPGVRQTRVEFDGTDMCSGNAFVLNR